MNVVSSMIGSGISFLSLEYLAFLLAAALVRYLCPERARTAVLLAFSWLFYAAWNPVCLLFLIFTTVTTYFYGAICQEAECPGGAVSVHCCQSRRSVFLQVLGHVFPGNL